MKRTLFVALVLAFTAVAGTALAGLGWSQDFKKDASGWLDTSSDWYGSIVAIGGHGVVNGDEDSGPFSRFGGYEDTWPGDYVAEIDVYLDPSWATGTGFDYSVAANHTNGNHLRDFIFHVAKDTSTGKLLVAGSNNTNFAVREDLETLNHAEVTEAGWYTLRHTFRNDDGALAVDLSLVGRNGEELFTETRTNPSDTIGDVVGGNRYAWFTFVTVDDLLVDNHELRLFAQPSSKDDCQQGGWEAFGFANQGRCVASIATAK